MMSSNDEFAVGTEYAELCVDEGTLFDYILLRITEPGRQGTNIMEAGVGAVNLRHPGAEKSAYVERTINMIGQTAGQSGGSFRGYLGDAKVERHQEPFQCRYAHGLYQPFSGVGESGAWIREESAAVGFVFGVGETDEVRLCTSWVADLRAVCARWGKKLVVCIRRLMHQ
jgi:hypothetical protein